MTAASAAAAAAVAAATAAVNCEITVSIGEHRHNLASHCIADSISNGMLLSAMILMMPYAKLR